MTRFACKLADLVFILSARYPTAERYCREYIVPSAKGIAISYSDEDMRREREKTGMPPPLCELSLLYRKICRKLLFHDGMVFHASVVAVANRAYGFTASSGTGKSTHAAQWRLKFDSAAVMVNDDKPLLRFVPAANSRAYGTPWCGKEGLQTPVSAPLRGIAVLERAAANRIERVSASAAPAGHPESDPSAGGSGRNGSTADPVRSAGAYGSAVPVELSPESGCG